MASVTHTLLNPGGHPVAGAHIEIVLLAPEPSDDAYYGDDGIIGSWIANTGVDGVWTVDELPPNGDIDPLGTVYRATQRPRTGATQVVYFSVPSDGATPNQWHLYDLLVDPPTDLPSPALGAANVSVNNDDFVVLTGDDAQEVFDELDADIVSLQTQIDNVDVTLALDDLTDVDTTGVEMGQHLMFDGTNWVPVFQQHTQFVYNSGGPQDGNRYNNWADLMDVLQVEGGPKVILFEQDETIPVGAWNLDNTTLRGNGLADDAGGIALTFGDNTTISSWANPNTNSVTLSSESTTGSILTVVGAFVFNLDILSKMQSTTVPFIAHSGSGLVIIAINNSSQFRRNGVENLITTAPAFGAQLVFSRGDNAVVDDDTLASTNPVVFLEVIRSVTNDVTRNFPSTHTNLNVGFTTVINLTFAEALFFDPSGLTVVTAENVQDAIEQLDAAVAGFGGGGGTPDAADVTYTPGGPTLTANDVAEALDALDTDFDGLNTTVGGLPATASGFYNPTITDIGGSVANVNVGPLMYARVGDIVSVSGYFTLEPSFAGFVQFDVDLPVASVLQYNDAGGAGTAMGGNYDYAVPVMVFGEGATATVTLAFLAQDLTVHNCVFTFTYPVRA